MLDPEALRSREIGDDPYAPIGAAKATVPMRIHSASTVDELEWQFQQRVTDLAEANGWEWHHQRNSIGSRKGWPDLVLWRPECIGQPGRFLLRELKRDGEQPQAGAAGGRSIAAAGGCGRGVLVAKGLAGDRSNTAGGLDHGNL